MNIVEKLLAVDAGTLQMPSKEVTLKLGKLNGQEFTFTCNAIDSEKMNELQEDSLEFSKKGTFKGIRTSNSKILIILESCDTFKNKDLMEHFNTPTPKELLKKLLLAGEIDELYNQIIELNGYEKDEDEEEEIKN